MTQPEPPEDNQPSAPEPGIRQQAAIGDHNTQIQGSNNWIVNTLIKNGDRKAWTRSNATSV
jgi:hypothetical protein